MCHERETGLFQAEYAAQYRYKDAEHTRVLSLYHDRALREQRECLERIREDILSTFRKGDIIVLTMIGGENGMFQETRTYQDCYDWHIYCDDGCTVGLPLVSCLSIETANAEWVPNG